MIVSAIGFVLAAVWVLHNYKSRCYTLGYSTDLLNTVFRPTNRQEIRMKIFDLWFSNGEIVLAARKKKDASTGARGKSSGRLQKIFRRFKAQFS